MKDKLNINLRIAEVTFSLSVKPEEEGVLRQAATEVNRVYEAYRKRFASSSPREVLAKVTLLFAQGYLTAMMQTKELDSILDKFESDLDTIINQ